MVVSVRLVPSNHTLEMSTAPNKAPSEPVTTLVLLSVKLNESEIAPASPTSAKFAGKGDNTPRLPPGGVETAKGAAMAAPAHATETAAIINFSFITKPP